jgi:predicted metal-dependent hydrolase
MPEDDPNQQEPHPSAESHESADPEADSGPETDGDPDPESDLDEPDLEDALRAGAAIYNAGRYHAAHDAWEERWLALESGTDDERLLHGLIQFTAIVYHGTRNNWSGARGLAVSASEYLSSLPPAYRGINVGEIRTYLRRVAADAEHLERRAPPSIRVDGGRVRLAELAFEPATLAARVLADELEDYDPAVIDRAIAYAREERAEDTRTTFIALVRDFVGDPDRRPLVYRRLTEHVQRRRQRERDVEDLFE